MPAKPKYTEDEILEAAFTVVRESGWENCTARSIAKALGSSTMPIYSYLKSMGDLKKQIVHKALALMLQYQTRAQSHMDFLDMGLGYVLFAKEERNLFRLMFRDAGQAPVHTSSQNPEADDFVQFQSHAFASLLGRLSHSKSLEGFSMEEKRGILHKAWIFSHGLAVLINNGVISDLDPSAILSMMKETGQCLIEGARTMKGRIKPNE
jgi:AcrR family transcriptional regulator